MFDFISDVFSTPEKCTTETFGDVRAQTCFDEDGDVVGGHVSNIERLKGETAEVSRGGESGSGVWIDEDGNTVRGMKLAGQFLKASDTELVEHTSEEGLTSYVGTEVSGPDFDIGATLNEDTGTLGVGAQVNAASAAVIAGTKHTQTDEYNRIGASEGVGAAARLHAGDADKDGHREYGFGFDLGPMSLDMKSEDPIRRTMEVLSLGHWDGDRANPNRSNMSEDTMRAGRDTIGSIVDSAEPVTGGLTDAIAGVDHTQGTRGGAKSFGEMGGAELTMNALFNDGMNPERRREVLSEQAQAITGLFGGMF